MSVWSTALLGIYWRGSATTEIVEDCHVDVRKGVESRHSASGRNGSKADVRFGWKADATLPSSGQARRKSILRNANVAALTLSQPVRRRAHSSNYHPVASSKPLHLGQCAG